jgi:site-specific recombinase XerD
VIAKTVTAAINLSAENTNALEKLIQQLHLKAYSPSTVKTYRNEFIQLLQLIKNKPVHSLTGEDLKRYMVHVMQKEKLSENTAHSRLNALKFYFEQVLGRGKFFGEIPRLKKRLQLPKVLGEQEINRLFKALTNKKHKAILFTAYSARLRVSEVVNLKIKNIYSDHIQILIECAKGKKDRYVMLSPVLLDILRIYIQKSNLNPHSTFLKTHTKPACRIIYVVHKRYFVASVAKTSANSSGISNWEVVLSIINVALIFALVFSFNFLQMVAPIFIKCPPSFLGIRAQ